jgi:hypothetical protein
MSHHDEIDATCARLRVVLEQTHMVNYAWWADNTAQVQRRFEQ